MTPFSMITTYEKTKQQRDKAYQKETPSSVEERKRRNKEMVRQRRMAVLRSEIYRKSMSPQYSLCAFIDANRDTEIGLRTFRQALSNHGIHFAPGDAAALFASIEGDENGTGIITWQQVRQYLSDTAPRPPTRSASRPVQSSPQHVGDTSTDSSSSGGALSVVDLNEECTHDSKCTCRRCVKSGKVVRRQLEEKLLQNEQPHTITPRPMPRPSHPGTSSSSSSSSASAESLSPVVSPLADTAIARRDEDSEDEEYNDETIRKLLARGTKLQREMDRAQQERPVLSVQDDENDDEVSSSSSSDDADSSSDGIEYNDDDDDEDDDDDDDEDDEEEEEDALAPLADNIDAVAGPVTLADALASASSAAALAAARPPTRARPASLLAAFFGRTITPVRCFCFCVCVSLLRSFPLSIYLSVSLSLCLSVCLYLSSAFSCE